MQEMFCDGIFPPIGMVRKRSNRVLNIALAGRAKKSPLSRARCEDLRLHRSRRYAVKIFVTSCRRFERMPRADSWINRSGRELRLGGGMRTF